MTDASSGDPRDRAPARESVASSHATSSSSLSPPTSAARRARDHVAAALDVVVRVRQSADATGPLNDVRGAIYAYITALRDESATIEQAVIATKELVAAALGTSPSTLERRALAEQVVRWGIDAYYEGVVRAD